MALTLSTQEVRLITNAQQAFLQPFNHETPTDWLLHATRYLKYLVGADKSATRIPVGESAIIVSHEFTQAAIAKYVRMEREVIDQFKAPLDQVDQQVWTRATLYGNRFAEYQKTAYYNEFIPLARNYYSMGMTVPVGGDGVGLPNTVSVYFNQDSLKRPAFGGREMHLLRLLFPSFEAGFRMSHQLRAHQETLARIIDALHLPFALFAEDGQRLHNTPVLQTYRQEEPEWDRVDEELHHLARRMVQMLHQPATVIGVPVTRNIETLLNGYILRGCVFVEGIWGAQPHIGIQVEAQIPPPVAGLLRSTFGLTSQESRIALLLGQHLGTQAIAKRLSLSIFTVRHHIEHLMQKLHIQKRTAIHGILKELSLLPD